MESSVADLFSDPEVEELGFINEWEDRLGSLEQSNDFWECLQEIPSPDSINTASSSCFDTPASPGVGHAAVERPESFPASAAANVGGWNSSCRAPSILSFSSPDSPGGQESVLFGDNGEVVVPTDVVCIGVEGRRRRRAVVANQEHVIAERKRREKISEKLFSLSLLIPGLKKRDKASILMDAIDYIKQMEQKMKSIGEEQAVTKERSVPTTATAGEMSTQLGVTNNERSSNDDLPPPDESPQPEIEARMSDKSVLIKMHCRGRKGALVKALAEIERLGLTVAHSNAFPFPDDFIDITVVATVEEGFSMTARDLQKELLSAFRGAPRGSH